VDAAAAAPDAAAKGLPRAMLGRPHLPSIIVTGASFWATNHDFGSITR
jgi:hypothetical protein